ncbi:MAG: hypothetical protein B7Z55_12435 [Planctomycetales bacterium 12-60-4]|nr:MAG: hypothetical protein B7Z55_12435 [Planctomycetales bacterium 12-60-4]
MPPWLQTFFEILMGGPSASTGEVLLRGALIGCSLFATVQMLTMLATRWGDHHAMTKSFILSVLVHLCIGLGWATVVSAERVVVEPPGEPTPIPIRQVLIETPEEVSNPNSGNTPFWQKPLDVPEMELARAQREIAPEELPDPERTVVEPPPSPKMDLAQFPTPTEEDAPVPQTTPSTAVAAATAPAAADIQPESAAESRSETGAVATSATRPVSNVAPVAARSEPNTSQNGRANRRYDCPQGQPCGDPGRRA